VEAARLSGLSYKITPVPKHPWFDRECKDMGCKLQRFLRVSRSQDSPPHLVVQYHKERLKHKYFIRSKKTVHNHKIGERLNSSRNPTEFWNAIKGIRPHQGATNPIPETKLKQFYEEIMLDKSTSPSYQETLDENLDKPINMLELNSALCKAKAKRAAGTDGIPAEFYKNLNEDKKCQLRIIINKIINT
jgi:hypothetical protein